MFVVSRVNEERMLDLIYLIVNGASKTKGEPEEHIREVRWRW